MFYVIGSWISVSHMQQGEEPFKWLPEPIQFSQKAFVQLNLTTSSFDCCSFGVQRGKKIC